MIEGHLQNLPFADLLQVIATGQKTGLLRLRREKRQARLTFVQGRILTARLEPGLYLGELLVRMELLTAFEVQELLQAQAGARDMSLGELALAAGLLEPDELQAAVRAQVMDTLTELCGWRSGSFAFRDAATATGDSSDPSFDTLMLLMEVVQRLEDWKQGSASPESIFMRAGDPSQAKLPAGGWEVLGYVNGQRNAASIAAELDLPERQVYRLLYQLAELGVIEASPYPSEGHRIMVLGSETGLKPLIQLSLRRAGLTPFSPAASESWLEALASARPRAVVIDDEGGEGWDVVRNLRQSPQQAHLPAVVLSESARRESWLARLGRPRAHVLGKPFKELELQQLVTRLVGRSLA